jgi:hypothetical protein
MDLMTADGQRASVPVTCGFGQDRLVALPSPGPVFLAIVIAPLFPNPQSLPVVDDNGLAIEEISFE